MIYGILVKSTRVINSGGSGNIGESSETHIPGDDITPINPGEGVGA